MDFSYEFELGQPEQVRATRVMYHRRRDTRLTYAFLVGCLLLVFTLHFYLRAIGREGWWPGLVIVVAGAIAGLLATYLSPYFMVKNIRNNNRAAAGPHVYKLSDTGLDVRAPGTATSVEWANVSEAYETPEFILFYVSKGMALLLPKRVVPEADVGQLRGALSGWLGQRAQAYRPQ